MDKNDALRISRSYLNRLKESDIGFSEAYMFGSFAKGNQHENSDIDIAIVLKDEVEHTFDTDVQLMITRKGEETIIEPHAFTKDEFDNNTPIVFQIIKHGIRIEL
ncbi:nucleotidyltransferase domain-containing protein [Geofilum rubicundum]|uniref:Predicted nucleotidyltransferases n=1 Tax=Geofilum rubicundum JCM 15548 TaxID=1236989 RepID=A0A0E9LST6_9BACT|nr:nucleotidyltransferase domain-containing protein [Geofilum rubicundum]GAO27890.1 predicted nucleotidyltransferases [Geofilum rubicundum JCM 15548]